MAIKFNFFKKTSWAHYSLLTGKILVAQAFALGALPLTINLKVKKNRMRRVNSKFHLARYNFCFWLVAAFDVLLESAIIYDFYTGAISQTSVQGVYRVLISISGLLYFFVNIHTRYRMDEISTFINGCVSYYENFQDKYYIGKKEKNIKEDLICGGFKLFYIVGLNFLALCLGLFYIFRCQFHILEPIGRGYICTQNKTHYNLFMVPFLTLMQIYFFEFHIVGLFLYIDIVLALLVFGKYTINQYLAPEGEARTKSILRTEESWDRGYRCTQIITRAINNCISDIFMPAHMFLVMGLFAFVLSGTIRFGSKLNLMILVLCGSICILIMTYIIIFLTNGASLLEKTEEMKQRKRARIHDKYMKAMVRTFRSNRLKIGEFGYLQRDTLADVLTVVAESTVDLLLMQ